MRTDTRYREQHRFWLDLRKDADDQLSAAIFELKRGRMFAQTVRDGIRLIVDLRDQRLDVLFELFPWVRAWLDGEIANARKGDDDLREKIARLEGMVDVLQRGHLFPPTDGQIMRPVSNKPAPVDDAEDVALLQATMKRDTSTQSAQNFINSMMNLQAGFAKQ